MTPQDTCLEALDGECNVWKASLRLAKGLDYHNRHVVEAEKKLAEIEQAIQWVKEQK